MGGRWGDSSVSRVTLPCKISTSGRELSLKFQEIGKTNKTVTFVVLLLSSSGPNLNALTATFRPFQSRFQRSVYPRVATGISSCILKSSLIRQEVGNLPNTPHNLRSTVNAVLLRSAAMSGCWRICRRFVWLGLPQIRSVGQDVPLVLSTQ